MAHKRKTSAQITKNRKKKEAAEAKQRKPYMQLSSKDLKKQCKEYRVKYEKQNKKGTVDRLLKAKKKQESKDKHSAKKRENTNNTGRNEIKHSKKKQKDKVKNRENKNKNKNDINSKKKGKKKKPQQQSAKLGSLSEDKGVIVSESNIKPNMVKAKSRHQRSSSIVIQLRVQAPKQLYTIPDMRDWHEIQNVKKALPIEFETTQIKLFYEGKELDDRETLEQSGIDTGCCLKAILDYNHFKPDSDFKAIEHTHINILQEIKKINDFKYFNELVNNVLMKKYGITFEYTIDHMDPMRILHGYCECLSGDRKLNDRRWTELHSACYDYQSVAHVEDVLRRTNLYIDTWTHSGYDTALILAINNHFQNEKVINLVEFLILNGARRRIRHTVVNLKRGKQHDKLYEQMPSNIRKQLIELLEPHIEEDPFKGDA